MELTTATMLQWLRRAATMIRAQREYLTELDAAIGDSDHGFNLDRGFAAVIDVLPTLEGQDAGAILKNAGMKLISTVGGASGPLYGTAFRRAGKVLEGHKSVSAADLREALRAFTDGVVSLGKATSGDKTMLDALFPAVQALEEAIDAGESLSSAISRAADAATAGAEATIPLVARRGRASYLGPRSAGHKDPGATSAALIIQALAETINTPI